MSEKSVLTKSRNEDAEKRSRAMERRPYSGDPLWSRSDPFYSSPFGLMRQLAEHMDRAFGNEWSPGTGGERTGTWSPAIDVFEREGKLVVHADLPGLNKDDLKVEAIDNSLVIQGERRIEHEEREGGYRRSERRYGSFYRTVPLPEGAQSEQARAQFKDGVLEVIVPVAGSQRRGREVPIETPAGSAERKASLSENTGETRVPKAG